MACHGQPWQDMSSHGKACRAMAGHGKPWKAMACHGKPWLAMAGHGLIFACLIFACHVVWLVPKGPPPLTLNPLKAGHMAGHMAGHAAGFQRVWR